MSKAPTYSCRGFVRLRSIECVYGFEKIGLSQKAGLKKLKNYFLDSWKKGYTLGANLGGTSGRKNGGCKSGGWSGLKFHTSE